MGAVRPLYTAVALALVLGAASAATAHLTLGFRAFTSETARRTRIAEAPTRISPLAVLDSQGRHLTLWDTDPSTRVWLVTFVYTRCFSVCSALGSEFQQLQREMRDGDGVRLASISFDRAHDTPAALAGYAGAHGADARRWTVAVPESGSGLARMLRETGVIVIPDGEGGYVHNAAIHVIDSSGRLVALYDLEQYREALDDARRRAR
jgi:protein SCO1/2